jgi:hypothetical protein
MAGGAGVEYYFGYKLPENDLVCEDYRSRDKSWDYCNIALNFFRENDIPFWKMKNRNDLIDNQANEKEKFCLTDGESVILVYLGYVKTADIDLKEFEGNFTVKWFNPREGGNLSNGSVTSLNGGKVVSLGNAPVDGENDWLIVLRKN